MKYLLGALSASLFAVAGAASAATVNVVEYPTGFFAPDEEATYDYPYYRGAGDDWGWTHSAVAGAFSSATLSISAFDVDFAFGEVDEIYVYNNGVKQLLGTLNGASDIYSYTTFALTPDLFDDIASGLQVWMDIDTANAGWLVTLGKSVLSLDGGTLPPPNPGAVVPVPAALPLIGSALAGLFGLGAVRRRRG